MFERTFVVFVDSDLSNDAKQVALTAASELFDVNAEFDHETDDGGEAKWITVKSGTIRNAEEAKAYIIACFHPELKSQQIITNECHEILQDAYGLWWRSLECEFKVRIKIVPEEDTKEKGNDNEIETIGIKIMIQGEHEPVAFASSYITELDEMVKAPPEEGDIDKANVRREFTTELMNFKELKWAKYSSYNPYVLKTLLKWIYFIKGEKPPDNSYRINFKPPLKENSLILVSSDEEDNIETETKSSKTDEIGEKLASALSSNTDDIMQPMAINCTSIINDFSNDSKRKIDQNNTNSSDDSVEILEPSTSSAGVPIQMTKKTSSKRFALSTSPLTSTTNSTSALTSTLNSMREGINLATSNVSNSTEINPTTAGFVPASSSISGGNLASYQAKSEVTLSKRVTDDDGALTKAISASRIQPNVDDVAEERARQTLTRRVVERLPVEMVSKIINYNILRPIIIDGSNVAMQAGKNKRFCCRAIMLAAKYFIERGHRVYAFVPLFRQNQNPDNPRRPMDDQWILEWMENRGLLVFTPSRQIVADDGSRRRINCYDDNMIVEYAHINGGIIVSKDNYRDVAKNQPAWAETIRDRLLMFTWINEQLMIPVDPLGRNGPSIQEFLQYQPTERIPMDAAKFMNESQCLKLLKQIDEALNSPPPDYQRFTGNNQNSWQNFNQSPMNYDQQQQSSWGFRSGARQQQRQGDQRMIHQWDPDQGVGVPRPWNYRPGSRHRSNSNVRDDRSRSHEHRDRSRSTSMNRQHQQQRRTSNDVENLVKSLSEIFPSDVVRRIVNENPGLIDADELGNLITDAM